MSIEFPSRLMPNEAFCGECGTSSSDGYHVETCKWYIKSNRELLEEIHEMLKILTNKEGYDF